ncbi:MAG TPA: RNA polymerase sigma factor [Terriglobales bacterium]|nr:RNA polymerase sigma factor [Terriglobales bacterium]
MPIVLSGSIPDESTWESVVWVHARLLYRICYAALRNHHDAEDAVQETLQRAWKYRHRLAAVEDPAAWLARIAWRVAKARRPRVLTVPLDLPGAAPEPASHAPAADQSASDRELRQLLDRHIQHLPAKLRQPLLLSTVEELSAREIGRILGIPEASVRTRCLRARRLLRDKLAAVLHPEAL